MLLLSSSAATSALRQRGLLAALVVPNAASARCVESSAAASAVVTAVACGEEAQHVGGGTQRQHAEIGAPPVASAQQGVHQPQQQQQLNQQQQQQLNQQQQQQQHTNGQQQHQVPHTHKLAAAGSRCTQQHQLETVWSSSWSNSRHQLPPSLLALSCCRALHTTPAAAAQPTASASASAPSQQQLPLKPEIASASEGPALLYRQGLESGMYRPDPLQQVTVQKLQSVFEALRAAHPAPRKQSGLTMVDTVGSAKKEQASWFSELSTLIKSGAGLHGSTLSGATGSSVPGARGPAVQGLYMFGGVGCGKTMLMDLLVAAAPKEFQVRRMHFHDFMLDVHKRLREMSGEADPLKHVADDVASGVKVLALDELFVNDVADAMILHRLFGRLWDSGLVLVATSNRAPDALYENGLQRQLFLPFIAKLKETCVIHNMNSPVDYRRLAHHTRGIYFLTPDRTALLHAAFLEAGQDSLATAATDSAAAASGGAAGGALGNPGQRSVQVAMGRQLTVPQALGGAAMFDFEDLCDRPLGAADYIALAENFSTLALADVPVFGRANTPAAYRFVTLVDVLYEHRVRLLVSAEGTPFELFERILSPEEANKAGGTTHGHIRRDSSGGGSSGGGGAGSSSSHSSHGSMHLQHSYSSSSSGDEGSELVVDPQLAFVKDRAISRLTEMQSIEYQLQYAKQHAPHLTLALQEMQQRERQQH